MKDVRAVFESYASRGVFRSYSETSPGHFTFVWLWDLEFRAVYNRKDKTITFRDLLPAIPPRSELERGIKAFIKECASKKRLEHRRYGPAKIVNRKGSVDLVCATPARNAVNLVNEIFLMYLNVEQTHYVSEHLHESDD